MQALGLCKTAARATNSAPINLTSSVQKIILYYHNVEINLTHDLPYGRDSRSTRDLYLIQTGVCPLRQRRRVGG